MGDDTLHGGLGADTLTGGRGLDGFWFDTALGASNVDTISDFKAVDDTIILDRSIFSGIATDGVLAASAFRIGATAIDADDRILYDKVKGNLYYDADGAGGVAAVLFAHAIATPSITAADFFAQP